MDTDLDTIIGIMGKFSKIDMSSVGGNTTLGYLELESLDFISVIFDLEDAFGISIPFNASDSEQLGWNNDTTLAGLGDLIAARRASASAIPV